jgi:phenylpyruvate tautomerase PptA (4-oxalocrotonate tautomerase family)
MPLVRISLPRQLAAEEKTAISGAVHKSLMEAFNVPEFDYFHVIEELETSQMFYPKSYLGIDHTEKIIFIQIIAASGRSTDQKQKLYTQIASYISAGSSIRKEDIIITLVENGGKENWSFGGGEIQNLTHVNIKG